MEDMLLFNFIENILSFQLLFIDSLHYKATVSDGLSGEYQDQSWNLEIIKSLGECGETPNWDGGRENRKEKQACTLWPNLWGTERLAEGLPIHAHTWY